MKTEKKYKLTDKFITIGDKKLYRIEALKDFSNIKEGDIGGFVESESNLSQYGDCWIYSDAKVYENAIICGNALVYRNAEIYGAAMIFGNVTIGDNVKVYGNARVFGNAIVSNNVKIFDYARVCGNAMIFGNSEIYDYATVFGNAMIFGNASIYGNATVYSYIKYYPQIYGNVDVFGDTEIYGNAVVSSNSDYIIFKNWWSSGRIFTWTRSNNMWRVGCFYGTGQELIDKAYEDSKLSGREYERVVKYVESILKDN